ncbi:MAG: galactose oxidase-like domain-containing protein [Acidimicrobiales bacterium]
MAAAIAVPVLVAVAVAVAPSMWPSTGAATAVAGAGPAFGMTTPAPGLGLDRDGHWGPVEDWPLIAIHAVLSADGDVVTYGTDGDGVQTGRFSYDVWTPGPSAAEGHITLANTTRTDLFCNLQLNRADTGDVLLFGGDTLVGGAISGLANRDIVSYDPDDDGLTSLPGMRRPRWYGTGTTLPDGSIYIQGGVGGEDRAERWTPEGGAELLPFATDWLDYWYPRNWVMPDGRLFGYDVSGRMYVISAELSTITPAGQLPVAGHFRGSSAVMYQPGRIVHFGGGSTTVLLIDATGDEPVVTIGEPLRTARQWVDATLLPDGRVLASGGAVKDAQANPGDPIASFGVAYDAEIWDPATGQWSLQAPAAVPRLYHSTALLLPDGRVLTAGGGAPGPVDEVNAELFSPDYLHRADGTPTERPVIRSLSATIAGAGDRLGIEVDDPTAVARVTLVKTGAVTHSFDMDRRFVELPLVATDTGVEIELPANRAVLTPGFYLVTALDDEGIPSVSRMLHVRPEAPGADQGA